MLEFLMRSTWVERMGWVLVHSLWQFALAAFIAVMLQRALQRRSATTRYAALLTAMALMVASPVATWLSLWFADAPTAAVRFDQIEKHENGPASQHATSPERGKDTVPTASLPAESPEEVAAMPQPEAQHSEPASSGMTSVWSLVIRRVQPWLPRIVLVWFAGVLLAAFRPLLSWYTIHRLRRAGVSPFGDAVHNLLERTAKKLKVTRAVEVLQSALVKTPVVVCSDLLT